MAVYNKCKIATNYCVPLTLQTLSQYGQTAFEEANVMNFKLNNSGIINLLCSHSSITKRIFFIYVFY